MTPLDFTSFAWSHSLLMDAGWAIAFALIYFAVRGYRAGAWVAAAGVLSHWVLDWWAHRPDMPLAPWSAHKYGLGLWNSVSATIIAEVGLFLIGLAMYLTRTRSKDGIGIHALWTFVLLMLVIWIAAVVGPPPPNVTAVKASGFALWLAVAWAYWIDRHRTTILVASLQTAHQNRAT